MNDADKKLINNKLKKELGDSLINIDDKDSYCFYNGFDDHGYYGKELKKNPSLVHWLWDTKKKKFIPLAVLRNHTACIYEFCPNEQNVVTK